MGYHYKVTIFQATCLKVYLGGTYSGYLTKIVVNLIENSV